jgi:hypothetical protein
MGTDQGLRPEHAAKQPPMVFEVRNAVLSFSIVRVGWDGDRVSAGMAVCEAVCLGKVNAAPLK